VLRFSLGLRLLADDVQLVSTVDERRQLGSVDVHNFTQKSPANVIGFLPRQMISFGASVPVPLKGLLTIVTCKLTTRRVKMTLAYFTITVIGLLRAYLCTSMSTSLHVVHCSSIPSLSIVGFDVALMQLSEQWLSE